MALLPTPIVDVTDFDFDSLRTRIYNLVRSAYPEWSEEAVGSFGNVLFELPAFVGDVLGFYLDARARESRLTQATQRQSVVALAKLLGYVPSGATAATADCIFTLAQAAAAPVPIPRGTIVRTRSVTNSAAFQTLEDLTIPAGELSVVGTVEHSATHIESFPALGTPSQVVQLAQGPHLDQSEEVEADNGLYERVESFLESTSASRHYTLGVDQYERAFIRFGNGTNGQLPTGSVYVAYKTGGGSEGNVERNSITLVEGSFTDTLGASVQLSCDNPARASGGGPRRSRAQIQLEAPARLRALTRTVGRRDYETNARRVPGVARALMLTSSEVPGIGENRGRLYIVPNGGGLPSSSMKQAVKTMVTETFPNTITFKVEVYDPAYLTVDIQAVVYPVFGITLPKDLAALDASIRTALAAFFALNVDEGTDGEVDNPAIDFGFNGAITSGGRFDGALALSDLMNVVRDVRGVRKLGDGINDFLLNGQRADLKVAAHAFPRLGTVTLLHGETRAPLTA
jgi:hypothetical protein